MKANLAPFIDLFSILAIGLMVIMSVTSGTEKPSRKSPKYSVVLLYVGKPDSIENEYPGIPISSLLRIEPYFLVEGKETSVSALDATVDVIREPGNITVLLMGEVNKMAVGFRIAEIVNQKTIFQDFDITVLSTSNSTEAKNHAGKIETIKVGSWVDPVVEL